MTSFGLLSASMSMYVEWIDQLTYNQRMKRNYNSFVRETTTVFYVNHMTRHIKYKQHAFC